MKNDHSSQKKDAADKLFDFAFETVILFIIFTVLFLGLGVLLAFLGWA
ncbi:hypothetical protein [Desmospora profundinema]|uniref:Uncharacterized protein n=1 Tax=Desmospora profundinema TaxID=1571184 RepID=A0ABU1IMZ2_9BACL|nr:hypothetical protein [Desmospora profundinema]MDR6226160.1 hypothetical protein [Desmospora profundinema]